MIRRTTDTNQTKAARFVGRFLLSTKRKARPTIQTSVLSSALLFVGCIAAADQTFPLNKVVDLGTLNRMGELPETVMPFGLSANGKVIVGNSFTAKKSQAMIWHDNAATPVSLSTLGGKNGAAAGLSADGTTIVGAADTKGNGANHAVKWLNGSNEPVDLGPGLTTSI